MALLEPYHSLGQTSFAFINSFLQEKQKPINYNLDFIPLNSSKLQGKSLKTLL